MAMPLLVARLEGQRLALPLEAVVRVVHACAMTPLPGAPPMVAGAINLHGDAVAVLDLRHRLGVPPREPRADDEFVVVRARGRVFALPVDDTESVIEVPAHALHPGHAIADGMAHVPGVVRLDDGLLLVEDPDRFLDPSDLQRLDDALAREAAHGD
jgi:purine-binding chemotaxis protein CheW